MQGIHKATNAVMAARHILEKYPGYQTAVALQIVERNRGYLQNQLPCLRLVTNGD